MFQRRGERTHHCGVPLMTALVKEDVTSKDVTVLQDSSWSMSPTRWLSTSSVIRTPVGVFGRKATRHFPSDRWILVGLNVELRWRPMTFCSVLSRKDDRLIGSKSFGVVYDNLPALGIKTIRDLSLGCESLPSVRDLLKIFVSDFVTMSCHFVLIGFLQVFFLVSGFSPIEKGSFCRPARAERHLGPGWDGVLGWKVRGYCGVGNGIV